MTRKYIEISSKGITKNAYIIKEDIPQVPIPVDDVPIDYFFEKYSIPEEYRKIFLVIEKRYFTTYLTGLSEVRLQRRAWRLAGLRLAHPVRRSRVRAEW